MNRYIKGNITRYTVGQSGGMNPGQIVFNEIYNRTGQISQSYKEGLIRTMLFNLQNLEAQKLQAIDDAYEESVLKIDPNDGRPYTKQEFQEFYGSNFTDNMWENLVYLRRDDEIYNTYMYRAINLSNRIDRTLGGLFRLGFFVNNTIQGTEDSVIRIDDKAYVIRKVENVPIVDRDIDQAYIILKGMGPSRFIAHDKNHIQPLY